MESGRNVDIFKVLLSSHAGSQPLKLLGLRFDRKILFSIAWPALLYTNFFLVTLILICIPQLDIKISV